jgi:Transglutaminase-like superfamily
MFRKDDWHKWHIIPGNKRRLIFECTLALALARLAVWTLPFRTISWLYGLREDRTPAQHGKNDCTDIAWALRAVAARAPWKSTCLVQALAGAAMLKQRAIPVSLVLGVKKQGAGREMLAAHAWLLSGTRCILGGEGREHYTAIATFRA